MTFTKSEITPQKTAYSATYVVDRSPLASPGPKQANIQLPPLIAAVCSIRKHKTLGGCMWHLSMRPLGLMLKVLGAAWAGSPRPATKPHHFYDILRNLLFNTAHYCWHTNLPQCGPIYGLINFYTAEPSPFPLILSSQNSYYIGFSYWKNCNKNMLPPWRCAQVSTLLLLKSFGENKICFCSKQNCLNVIYFYVPKKIYCEVQHWFRT